ncbi:MAG TPA: YbgC/FadM family acyl-CoA thioesterase [Allosphingosinicella sp.]|nr:YbgC/FadM family acyl-CoA thioesterase [Allosphingosinicella sp.]
MSGGDIDTPYRGGFRDGEHRFAVRVYIEDTDAAGIVYYANYLKYIERARSDILRALGVDQRAFMEAGEGAYAVAEARIKYHRPAKLDDDLVVVSTVSRVLAASVTIHQRVRRGEELLAHATIVAAFVSPDGRPKRQPKAWIDVFKPLVKREEEA